MLVKTEDGPIREGSPGGQKEAIYGGTAISNREDLILEWNKVGVIDGTCRDDQDSMTLYNVQYLVMFVVGQ